MEDSHDKNFVAFDLHFGTEREYRVGDGVYCPMCGDETYGNDLCGECGSKMEDEIDFRTYVKEHKHKHHQINDKK